MYLGLVIVESCDGVSFILPDVLCAPSIRRNFISVDVLDEKGCEVRFAFNCVTIRKDGHVIIRAKKVDGLYLTMINNNNACISSYLFESTFIVPYTWHLRLEYVYKNKMLRMSI